MVSPLRPGWPYLPVCITLGLALGWIPRLLHGPVPHKFDVVSLAMPGCGLPCLRINLASAGALGFVEAGLAFWLTGRHRAEDPR